MIRVMRPLVESLVARVRHPSENTALLGMAAAVGLASGIGIWLYRAGIDFFSHLFRETLAQDVLGPLLGAGGGVLVLVIVGTLVGWMMARFVGKERHHGVAGIIEAVALAGGRLRYAAMPVKTLASALSLGAGASTGPEGPSVVVGANIGSFVGQKLHVSEDRTRLLVAAGAASAISAAFRAPIAGVFFALEVILNGEFNTGSFGVVVLASVISAAFTQAIHGGGNEFGALNFTMGSPVELLFYAVLGFLLAPVAVLFIRVVHWQHHIWDHLISMPRPIKVGLAGLIVGLIGLAVPQILGAGREEMITILQAHEIEQTVTSLLLIGLVKIFATAVTNSGGFVGGIFAPSLFVGTMLGAAFGQVVTSIAPLDMTGAVGAYAIAGMAAVMAGVVRAPITGVLLVFELTNDYRLILPIMLTTVICVYITERFIPAGIEILFLHHSGIRLEQGRDVDVMQGVTVREAMVSPAPAIPENASLSELRLWLRQAGTRALCVVDANANLSGIVTLTDLQRAYEANGNEAGALHVGDICTRDVVTTSPDDVLWQAIRAMGARDIGRLPVIKSGRLVGMVGRSDILHAYNTAITRKRAHQHRVEQIRLNTLTGAHVIEMHAGENSLAAGKLIRDVKWPHESVIASIRRNGRLLVPHGDTDIRPGDTLMIVAAPEAENELARLLGYETADEFD